MYQIQPFSILLVEDDESTNEALCSLLTMQFPRVSVYSATDGKTGLDCFRSNLPDVVITDINMPEMNGVEMLKNICSIKADTRIVVVTAHSDELYLDKVTSIGINVELVFKPIDFAVLFAAINRCTPS